VKRVFCLFLFSCGLTLSMLAQQDEGAIYQSDTLGQGKALKNHSPTCAFFDT